MEKILNKFPAEYDVILDGLESHLDKDLTINHIHEKLNNCCTCIEKNNA